MVGLLDFLRGSEVQNRLAAAGQPAPSSNALQFWNGSVNEAVANNGDRLVRMPDGSIQRTSAKYGWTEVDRSFGGGGGGAPRGGILSLLGSGNDMPEPSHPGTTGPQVSRGAPSSGGGLLSGIGGLLGGNSARTASSPLEPSNPHSSRPQTRGTAMPSMPQSGGTGLPGFLGRLFGVQSDGGANYNGTVQWLLNRGYSPEAAAVIAGDSDMLNKAIVGSGSPQGPTETQERLERLRVAGVDPNTAEGKHYLLTGDLPDERGDSWINVGGGRVFNTRTGEFRTSPDRGTDAPSVQTFYDEKSGQEYKAEWDAQRGEWVPIGGQKAPSGMSLRTNPDGTVELVQGSGAGQKLTEGQSKDVLYYTRGIDANQQLDQFETELTDLVQSGANLIPLGLGNYFQSPQFQQAKQAGDNFLAAVLRKDTGAAVTKTEFQLYGAMFLPVPGDSKEVVQQKRRARQVALDAIKSGMGTAEAIAVANEQKLGIETGPVPAAPAAPKGDRPSGGNRTRSGVEWSVR